MAAVSPDAYSEHRDYVLAVLARRCGWLRAEDREAVLHDAYLVLLEKQRDGTLDPSTMGARELRAYLVQTAINKTLNEGQRAERTRTEPLGDAALAAPDAGRSPEERAAASLDRARLREIIAELPRRRQAIVKLRFFFERTPEEIQRYLGITERAYRREFERAMRQIAERYELVRSGAYCDTRRSMILALIAGLAGPNRARDAREHLRSCPGCAHWAAAALDAGRWVLGKALPKVLPKDKTVCNDFGTYELVLRVDQNGKLVLEHGADHTKVGKIGKAPVEPPAQIREEWSVTMPELRNG